ncbi:MAG: caspase family protein [Elusimicrobia bacterium]|nr:caspase family protein [Elusimicrobiota bacterium]
MVTSPPCRRSILALAVACLGLPAAGGETAAPSKPLLTVQKGHTAAITAIGMSKDGKYLVSASEDDSIKLWDFATGKEVLTVQEFRVKAMMVCPAGDRVVTIGSVFVSVRELPSLKLISHRDLNESETFSVAEPQVSPDCLLTAATFRKGREIFGPPAVFDAETGRLVRKFDTGQVEVERMVFSPDGRFLLADGRVPKSYPGDGDDGQLFQFSVATGELKRKSVYGRWMSGPLLVNPDGRFAVAGRDHVLFDLDSGETMGKLNDGTGEVVLFPGFLNIIRSKQGSGLSLWTVGREEKIRTLEDSDHGPGLVSTTKDIGRIIAGQGGVIRVWEAETGKLLREFGGRSGIVHGVAFSPDRRFLALGLSDATARVWDLEAGREVLKLAGHGGQVMAVAFSPDGKFLATGGEDHLVKVWSMPQGDQVLSLAGHSEPVTGLAVTGDGRRIVSSGHNFNPWGKKGEDTLRVWDSRTGEPVWSVPSSHGVGGVDGIALSPDGGLAAVSWQDQVVEVWDLRSRTKVLSVDKLAKERQTLGVRFSPDGKRLVVLSYRKMLLFDTSDWRLEREELQYHGDKSQLGLVDENFDFSGNGRRLTGLGMSSLITADLPGLTGHTKINVRSESAVSLSVAQGRQLAAVGSQDGTARVYDLEAGRELFALVSLDKGWAAVSPEGYFDGSEDGLKTLTWSMGTQSFPLEAFSEGYYSPGLVPAALAGQSPAVKGQKDLSLGFAAPPKARITSPRQGSELTRETVEVTVAAEDQGGGIDEIRLYHNGKAVGGETRDIKVAAKAGAREQSFQVTLAEGENLFKAVGLSKDRIEGPPDEVTVTLKGPSKEAVLHVLVAGINKYKNGAMNLNFARPDAQSLADFFTASSGKLFKEVRRRELFDEAATKDGLVRELKTLAGAGPQDVAVIYLAGHGDTVESTWYFVPHELVHPEDEDEMKARALSSSEFQELIKGVGAKKVLVLVDACKSGGALLAWAGRGVEERKALAKLARASGVYIVAAATDAQVAAEVKTLGHGVFTYSLLEALKGAADANPKDGVVMVGELLGYVEEALPELTLKYKSQAQYPVKFAGGMDFPITTVRP